MAIHQIQPEALTEGASVLVDGRLVFGRLRTRFEGEELVRRNQGRTYPVTSPHTTVTVGGASVRYRNPAAPTIEEQYVAERVYTSKTHPEHGPSYSLDSKGNNLPEIYAKADNGHYVQDDDPQELANGLDVTLVITVYKPRAYEKRGLALTRVLVNEPIRYYGGGDGVDTADLASRGIVFDGASHPVRPGDHEPSATPADPGEEPAADEVPAGTVIDENGFAAPAPTAVPAPTPAAASAPAPADDKDAQIARMKAELARLQGTGSAVGPNPWDEGPGIRPQA